MRDPRKDIVKALITVINAKNTGATVYTKINKPVDGETIAYPYILISDIYLTESGSKRKPIYDVEFLLQIVYKDINSKVDLWDNMSSLAGIVTSKRDLTVSNSYSLMLFELLSTSEEEILTDTGTLNIGLLRYNIKISDNN